MKQERIFFKDVIELGFKVKHEDDPIFYNQYGFEYQIVTYKINSRVHIDWDCITGYCEVICTKSGTIKGRFEIKNKEELIQTIKTAKWIYSK